MQNVIPARFLVFVLERAVGEQFAELRLPGALSLLASAVVILAAAIIASALPPARAARVRRRPCVLSKRQNRTCRSTPV